MKNLERLRREKGYTQKKFGALFGVSAQTVLDWENGFHYPKVETLIKIRDKFHVSIDYLLDLDINEHISEYLINQIKKNP